MVILNRPVLSLPPQVPNQVLCDEECGAGGETQGSQGERALELAQGQRGCGPGREKWIVFLSFSFGVWVPHLACLPLSLASLPADSLPSLSHLSTRPPSFRRWILESSRVLIQKTSQRFFCDRKLMSTVKNGHGQSKAFYNNSSSSNTIIIIIIIIINNNNNCSMVAWNKTKK